MKCPICVEINQESTVSTLETPGFTSRKIRRCSEGHCFEVKPAGQHPRVMAWVPEGNWAAMRHGSERKAFDPDVLQSMGLLSNPA